MKKFFGFLLLVSGAAQAQTQEQPKALKIQPSQVSNAPVTRLEASHIIFKMEKAFASALHLPEPKASSAKPGAITRGEIVLAFDQAFSRVKGKFTYKPQPQYFEADRLTLHGAALTSAERMIELGLLARVGPLVTSKKETISIEDFGDAVGYFMARVAELSHQPTTRFSPYLESPE